MCAVGPAARPSSGGCPRRAAPPRSNAAAGSRALEAKKARGAAPPARGVTASAAGFCATKRKICNGVQVEMEVIAPVGLAAVEVVSSVPTQKRARSSAEAGGDPALDRLHKRMALELEALRELVKKAELISQAPARKGGAPPAAGETPSAKKRKVSPLPEQNQKQSKAPPRMSADERKQLAGRMALLVTVPDDIMEFLQKQLGGGADEIEIDFHSAEDSVLFELQARLDKLAAEERRGSDAVAPKEEQEFLQKQLGGGADEIEIDFHSAEDSVLFELQARLDKLAAEERRGSDAVAPKEEQDSVAIMEIDSKEQDEEDIDICGASDSDSDSSSSSSSSDFDGSSSSSDSSGSSSSSDSSSESDSDEVVNGPAPPVVLPDQNAASSQPPPEPAAALPPEGPHPQPPSPQASEVAQSADAGPKNKIQDTPRAAPKVVSITGALYKAKTRRQLLEMEKAVVPDESIHERDLRRLCIAEYGGPGIMRQLGLYLKADA
ncbi:unnamed protein product [Urochloa humidicola]